MTTKTSKPKEPKRRLRRSVFSLDKAEIIFKMISQGNYVETAAAHAGIGKSTYHEWIRRGKRELIRLKDNPRAKIIQIEADFVFFYQKVQTCLADAEVRALGRIMKAAEGGFVSVEIKETKDHLGNVIKTETIRKSVGPQWQAEAWRLERMSPRKFGRRIEVAQAEKGKEDEDKPEEVLIKCIPLDNGDFEAVDKSGTSS